MSNNQQIDHAVIYIDNDRAVGLIFYKANKKPKKFVGLNSLMVDREMRKYGVQDRHYDISNK